MGLHFSERGVDCLRRGSEFGASCNDEFIRALAQIDTGVAFDRNGSGSRRTGTRSLLAES
jgi:hypothetical protein